MVDNEVVIQVANEICGALRKMPPEHVDGLVSQMVDYHGSGKYRFSDEMSATAAAYPGEIQAELVCVNRDLSNQVHYHERSYAYVVCLGANEHLPDPRNAIHLPSRHNCYYGNVFEIPRGRLHGFTVGSGGVLYLLSVQNPPITGDGQDDYHVIPD